MSGPLSSNEIEDVVSSVHRLVSVETRPRSQSRGLAQDRLVLTPALRIVPEADGALAPLVMTVPVADEHPSPAVPTQVLARTQHRCRPAVPQTYEADWEEELWAEPDPPPAELALGTEDAELLGEIFPADLAAGCAGTDQPVGTPSGGVDTLDAEAPWIELGGDKDPSDTLAQKVTDLRAETRADLSVPKGAVTRADVLKLSPEDLLTDGEGNPLTFLDEAALQQLIRHLIRKELKGVLGERITQSVRKLVRAEINRAFAAHALD